MISSRIRPLIYRFWILRRCFGSLGSSPTSSGPRCAKVSERLKIDDGVVRLITIWVHFQVSPSGSFFTRKRRDENEFSCHERCINGLYKCKYKYQGHILRNTYKSGDSAMNSYFQNQHADLDRLWESQYMHKMERVEVFAASSMLYPFQWSWTVWMNVDITSWGWHWWLRQLAGRLSSGSITVTLWQAALTRYQTGPRGLDGPWRVGVLRFPWFDIELCYSSITGKV